MILAFDTSGPYIAAALWDENAIVAARHEDMARGQAEALFDLLEATLADAGVSWNAISAIGVGIGPGNFTGVRLSVASARGLARSLAIPAHGVSLLEAVALGSERPVLACLAAPREQVYVQGFGVPQYETARLAKAVDVSVADVLFVGSGAELVASAEQIAPAAFAPASANCSDCGRRWWRIATRAALFARRRCSPIPRVGSGTAGVTFDEMAALHARCFDVAPRAWSAEEFAAFAENQDISIHTCDGGLAVIRVGGGEAELLTLAVSPERRREGLALALCQEAMESARKLGAEVMYLEVAGENHAASSLYQRCGFEQVGMRKDYYAGPRGQKMSALVMKRTI